MKREKKLNLIVIGAGLLSSVISEYSNSKILSFLIPLVLFFLIILVFKVKKKELTSILPLYLITWLFFWTLLFNIL